MTRAVILVEGESDKAALETLAARLGRSLAAEGTEIHSVGGAGNVRHYMEHLVPRVPLRRSGLVVAGLYDIGEMREFRQGLEGNGFGPIHTPEDMEYFGFFACHYDLEDELIRALGPAGVEAVIKAQWELASFRRMQAQPDQRRKPLDEQLHRFMGTKSGRKVTYAQLVVDALPLEDVPRPLRAVLERV